MIFVKDTVFGQYLFLCKRKAGAFVFSFCGGFLLSVEAGGGWSGGKRVEEGKMWQQQEGEYVKKP